MSSRRDRLTSLRSEIEAAIDGAETKDLAALSREYRAILAEIEGIPDPSEVSVVDEIAQRRNARRSGSAARSGRTKRSS